MATGTKEDRREATNRFYWNPETGEKIFTHWQSYDKDGKVVYTLKKLTPEQEKKAVEFATVCTRQSNKFAESDVNLKKKSDYKRLGKDKPPVGETSTDKPIVTSDTKTKQGK